MQKKPTGNIAGINYSGFHDSSIAIINPTGEVLFAKSLERVSRVKQDGRPPEIFRDLLEKYDVELITTSTNEYPSSENPYPSKLHTDRIARPEGTTFVHENRFNDFLASFNLPVIFVDHQLSHAASAIAWSDFSSGNCFTYDGGMCNSNNFGAIFSFETKTNIDQIDVFDYRLHPKITTLYSFITGYLGFTPNKHEGKITGLAAHGKFNADLQTIFATLFTDKFLEIEQFANWIFSYSDIYSPELQPNYNIIDKFKTLLEPFSPQDLAANIQIFSENHVLEILKKSLHDNLIDISKPICLAGGLFSNVRINQKVFELGFPDIFVAPAMTDDGTALGSAWAYLLDNKIEIKAPQNAYFGHAAGIQPSNQINLVKHKIRSSISEFVAEKLANNEIVAVLRDSSEFGPRALGNRSILASATDVEINISLNDKLARTEFMPFAPILRDSNYSKLFLSKFSKSTKYMTITCDSTQLLKDTSPAVVHVDGTARPQILEKSTNEFLYEVLEKYEYLTGFKTLINTSFNVHEEPIVDSENDALRGFLISGLDWLISNEDIYSYETNKNAALEILRKELHLKSRKERSNAIIKTLQVKIDAQTSELIEKESVIQNLIKREN